MQKKKQAFEQNVSCNQLYQEFILVSFLKLNSLFIVCIAAFFSSLAQAV